MAQGRTGARRDGKGRAWRQRARSRLSIGLSTLLRLRSEIADRPRRIDRFIDYFEGRRAEPVRG